jgi:hypothetical protein
MILKDHLDVGAKRTPISLGLGLYVGLTLKFICALRAIVRGLIRSRGDTMYYKRMHCDGRKLMAMVILSYGICLSLGTCVGFIGAGFCASASDKA